MEYCAMVKMDETAKYVLIYCQAKQQREQLSCSINSLVQKDIDIWIEI